MDALVNTGDSLELDWARDRGRVADAGALVCSFLDVAVTALGRATHYNSREQQDAGERAAHAQLLGFDRDLYALLLCVPGVSDRARQIGARGLLGSPRAAGRGGLLDAQTERALIEAIVRGLPAHRMLELFARLATGEARVNNARTRKLVLRTVLSSPRLELWSVKYRSKLRDALVHAYGRKTASFLRRVVQARAEARARGGRAQRDSFELARSGSGVAARLIGYPQYRGGAGSTSPSSPRTKR